MHPSYWAQFIDHHRLIGRCIQIPEAADVSGLGADLQVYTAEQSREEAEQLYPGIAVTPDGFVPVAQCLIGSGDPYFINVRDGEGGALYRIYHDAVSAEYYDPAEAVAVVLRDSRDLLRYADT
jgi:hypothetical protein